MDPQNNQGQPNQTSNDQLGPTLSPQDTNMVMAVLSYLGPLVVVSFIMAKNDLFVKFHIKQGLVLLVLWFAIWVIESVFWQIFWQFGMLFNLLHLAVTILAVIGIINAVQKKETPLPLVGAYSKYFTF